MSAVDFLRKKFSVPDGRTITSEVPLPTCWGVIAQWMDEFRDVELEDDEPYFGWCDVKGCRREGSSGGGSWSKTGYWTTCSDHGIKARAGKPQPEMKAIAVEREAYRKTQPNGYLKGWNKKTKCGDE